MAKKGQLFKKYSPELKISVILDMRENRLSYFQFYIRKMAAILCVDNRHFFMVAYWK